MSQAEAMSAKAAMKQATTNVPGAEFREGAQFFVRTLQKPAHLRRKPRGFPRCALSKTGAHLRTGCEPSNRSAAALDPVPLARKVAQPLDSASIALFEKDFRGATLRRPRRGVGTGAQGIGI